MHYRPVFFVFHFLISSENLKKKGKKKHSAQESWSRGWNPDSLNCKSAVLVTTLRAAPTVVLTNMNNEWICRTKQLNRGICCLQPSSARCCVSNASRSKISSIIYNQTPPIKSGCSTTFILILIHGQKADTLAAGQLQDTSGDIYPQIYVVTEAVLNQCCPHVKCIEK